MSVPTRTVGVVGGGQLARMLHQAAISLGVRVVVLDPDPACSAALAGADRFGGTWASIADLTAFSGKQGVELALDDGPVLWMSRVDQDAAVLAADKKDCGVGMLELALAETLRGSERAHSRRAP